MPARFFYFVKTWYDGMAFVGSQFQPMKAAGSTVEGVLVTVLQEFGYIPEGPHNDFVKCAGRTDRGVSARSAVYYLGLTKPLHPNQINDWLARHGIPLVLWSVATIPAPENPRQAASRTYKYFYVLAGENINSDTIQAGLDALQGEHDFRGFTKAGFKLGTRTVRTLDVASLKVEPDAIIFTFTSRGFLREQVRRMVAFLLANQDSGDIMADIQQVFDSGVQPNIEPAPPAGLILWDVAYSEEIAWQDIEACGEYFRRAMERRYIESRTKAMVDGTVFDALQDGSQDP
jgi:tRNA pseudouridine(38-40) synthase